MLLSLIVIPFQHFLVHCLVIEHFLPQVLINFMDFVLILFFCFLARPLNVNIATFDELRCSGFTELEIDNNAEKRNEYPFQNIQDFQSRVKVKSTKIEEIFF